MPIDVGVRVGVSRLDEHSDLAVSGPMIRGIGPFFMGDTFLHQESSGPKVLTNALSYLAQAFGDQALDMAIVVHGSLAPGRGLGSSAALSVALVRAIYRYMQQNLSDQILIKHALALETIFHGQPSGIDHAVVISAQPIAFRRQAESVEYRAIDSSSSSASS